MNKTLMWILGGIGAFLIILVITYFIIRSKLLNYFNELDQKAYSEYESAMATLR